MAKYTCYPCGTEKVADQPQKCDECGAAMDSDNENTEDIDDDYPSD